METVHVILVASGPSGGLGVETPILLPRATTFLVKILSAAFNAVPPELVVLISTTSSGRTELNAVSTKKMVARGRKSPKIGVSTPSPPRLKNIGWGHRRAATVVERLCPVAGCYKLCGL